MSKLIELQNQIDKLQKQAAEIRGKEFVSTVAEIRNLMNAYGITIKDLQAPKGKSKVSGSAKALKKNPSKAKVTRPPVPAKYQGPNGETWSGRGLAPKWLTALISAGQSKEAFLVLSNQ